MGAAARGAFWGGAIVASNGEAVNLFLSEAYLPDESVRQAWADFVARLYHGSELAALRIYVAPLALIESMCGPGTGGCYSLSARAAMVPGEDLPDGTTKETVLAHELGHHVAASRDNYPWTAAEWGTKRWASYADVCARQAVGAAFPGDQGDNYHLNPGEAFAEVYRLLNFQALGLPAAIWNSDVSFYPDAAALEAARLDVVSPWTGATATSWSGRFGRPAPKKPPALKTKAKRRRGAGVVGFAPVTRTIQTPHDGVLTVTVGRAPPETLISLHDASGSELVPPTPGPISFTVCGQRTLSLAVTTSIAGDFRVTISTP